jgi:hypothetical protein
MGITSSTEAQHLRTVIASYQQRDVEERAERASAHPDVGERTASAIYAQMLERAHEATLTALTAKWALQEAALVEKVAAVTHELDLTRGVVSARTLLEVCLRHIRTTCQRLSATAIPASPTGAATKLLDGSSYPALVAYLGASAAENGADAARVLARARKLCGVHCGPIHEVSEGSMPAELFAESAREREVLIAFTALVRFAGRDPGLYAKGGPRTRLVLRVPPGGLRATPKELAAAPLLPTEISLGLLMEQKVYTIEEEGVGEDFSSSGGDQPSTPPAVVQGSEGASGFLVV